MVFIVLQRYGRADNFGQNRTQSKDYNIQFALIHGRRPQFGTLPELFRIAVPTITGFDRIEKDIQCFPSIHFTPPEPPPCRLALISLHLAAFTKERPPLKLPP